MSVLDLPDKKRPAPSVPAMEKWIHDAERETGVAPKRLGWVVASTVVVAALQRALADDQEPAFLVKGGVYIEFHLGLAARTTTDIDALFRGGLAEFEQRLDEALALPWGPFDLVRTEIEVIKAPKLVQPRRFWVKLMAKGRVWRRVKVEVSFPEGGSAKGALPVVAPNIGFFGLQTPQHLLGMAMDYQVAQKLHAASDPDEEGYENQRVHDILDLLLIKNAFYTDVGWEHRDQDSGLDRPDTSLRDQATHPRVRVRSVSVIEDSDQQSGTRQQIVSLRAACVEIFDYRADEAEQLGRPVRRWPPVLHINGYWRAAYPPLAAALGVALTLEEAVAAVEAWVAEIDAADHEPEDG